MLDDRISLRMAAGAPGRRPLAVELSTAHATTREFGIDSAFSTADAVLAQVLSEDGSLADDALGRTLQRYADALGDVSVLGASSAALPVASVDSEGRVAIVHPGTGDVALPSETELVVVDLRHLPDAPELEAVLRRSIAPALQGEVAGLSRLLRTHDGPVDEQLGRGNVYRTGLSYRDEPAIVGSAIRAIPIVLLVGERIAPAAARLVAGLRAARRAWIAGETVPLAVAESTWRGVGPYGLGIRTSWIVELERQPSFVTGEIAEREGVTHEFELGPGTEVMLSSSSDPDDRIDLYLLHDENEDGLFATDEIVDYVGLWGGLLAGAAAAEPAPRR